MSQIRSTQTAER